MDLHRGDIILVDSKKLGPRIVKFFMTAPTIWHHIFRAITGKQKKVLYYHAIMALSNTQLIEQQYKVQLKNATRLKGKYVVYRLKTLTEIESKRLEEVSTADLDDTYDIPLVIGKFMSWLTGIPLFRRIVQAEGKEICITQVGDWYKKAIGETFGVKTIHDLTTYIVDDFCRSSSEWEKVFESK